MLKPYKKSLPWGELTQKPAKFIRDVISALRFYYYIGLWLSALAIVEGVTKRRYFSARRRLFLKRKEQRPTCPQTRMWLGHTHYKLGELDLAYAEYDTALRLNWPLMTERTHFSKFLQLAPSRMPRVALQQFLTRFALGIPHHHDIIIQTLMASALVEPSDRSWIANLNNSFSTEPLDRYTRLCDIRTPEELESEKRLLAHSLVPATTHTFKLPSVFGQDPAQAQTLSLPVHEFKTFTLDNAMVAPAANVVTDRGELLIYEPANHPKNGFVSGSWRFVAGSPRQPALATVNFEYTTKRHIKEGVLIAGRNSRNYFHWLIEYLPRFEAVRRTPALKNVPIIVNGVMPIQHYEALYAYCGDTPVEFVKDEMLMKVDRLHIPSYVTSMFDDPTAPLWKSAGFSASLMKDMREQILAHCRREKVLSPAGKKIYLSRKWQPAHALKNEAKVQSAFEKAGFDVVYAEMLSFFQQVALFNYADVIAGPSGAVFANCLFCQPGAKVASLIIERHKEYTSSKNLADLSGADFVFLTGQSVSGGSEFEVPMKTVNAYLETLK